MTNTGAVTAIGALADPIRMRLYRFVSTQQDAVSREEAAEALGMPLTKAKFHLERLAEAGLLDIEYRRMTGRQGPGAGRPAKLYRRSTNEFQLSLPARRYDLMGEILASAVMRSRQGEQLDAAIDASAYVTGQSAAQQVGVGAEGTTTDVTAQQETLERANAMLTALGYEAEQDGGSLRLRNCPFDSLAKDHTELVCGANVQFVQGVLDGAGCTGLQAHLEPCPGYCCVTARTELVCSDGAGPAATTAEAPG